MEWLDRRKIMK